VSDLLNLTGCGGVRLIGSGLLFEIVRHEETEGAREKCCANLILGACPLPHNFEFVFEHTRTRATHDESRTSRSLATLSTILRELGAGVLGAGGVLPSMSQAEQVALVVEQHELSEVNRPPRQGATRHPNKRVNLSRPLRVHEQSVMYDHF
jgi:hypothetical protein